MKTTTASFTLLAVLLLITPRVPAADKHTDQSRPVAETKALTGPVPQFAAAPDWLNPVKPKAALSGKNSCNAMGNKPGQNPNLLLSAQTVQPPARLHDLSAKKKGQKLPPMSEEHRPSVVVNGVGGPEQTSAYKLDPATGRYEVVDPIRSSEIERFRRAQIQQGVTVIDVQDVQAGSVEPDQIMDMGKHPELAEPYRHPQVDERAIEERHARIPAGKNNIQDASAPGTTANSLVQGSGFGNPTLPDAPPATGGVSFLDSTLNVEPGPPDTDMSAGPNNIITDYNLFYSIWTKAGVLQAGNRTFRSLFTGLASCGSAAVTNLSDPQVSYDDQNDRFVFAMLAYTGGGGAGSNSFICIAVTKNGDPVSGGFWNAQIAAPVSTVADYPHIGIGEDAIFIGTNNFNGAFTGAMITAVNKAQLYSGAVPASRQTLMGASWRPQPAERRGYNQGQYPPLGSPHYFVVMNNGTAAGEVWRWAQPTFSSNAVFWGAFNASGGTPANPAGATFSTFAMDALGNGFMDAELRWPKLWTARTGLSATFDAVQWAEVDVSGGAPALGNNGLYTLANNHLWLPDVTVDRLNNMAVGMTRAAAAGPGLVFPGAYISGRENGVTPVNQLEALAASKAGEVLFTGVQNVTGTPPIRWGDYQGVTIDPNGCDIWYTGPFSRIKANPNVATWVQKFKFPSCSVASALYIDKNTYTCSDSMTITVQDNTLFNAAFASAQITITTGTDTENIAAGSWICDVGCAGGNGTQWHAVIPVIGSAGANQNGTVNFAAPATVTVTYVDTHPTHTNQIRTAAGSCTPSITDGGFLISGGCDNTTGTQVPLTPVSELYNPYMDNGEFSSYTFGFTNSSDRDLSNATATLAATGAGAANVTIYNPSVNIGRVPKGGLTGAAFNIGVSGAPGLTPVTLTLSVTSPGDGYTTPAQLVQTQYLQTNDTITRYSKCYDHNSQDMTDSIVGAGPLNPWIFRAPVGQGGETMNKAGYFGTTCANATVGSIMIGNFATAPTTNNYAANADSTLIGSFPPVNSGNAGNGQPWNYVWVAHSFFTASEAPGATNTSGAWGGFYNPDWNTAAAPNGDQVGNFQISLAYYYQTLFDGGGVAAWDWDATDAGTPQDPTTPPRNEVAITFSPSTRGPSPIGAMFAFGHEHFDVGNASANRDIALDNDQIIYDQYFRTSQGAAASCPAGQVGQVAFGAFSYSTCPASTIGVSVMDPNAIAPFNITVTSPGTGDSETVVMSGAAPYFTGSLNISTIDGVGANSGLLFVLPVEVISASYTDTAPAGSSGATAAIACNGGDVVYVSNAIDITKGTGDADVYADNKETIFDNITIKNNTANTLTNVRVKLMSVDPDIDCIADSTANFGTVAAGATATNPGADQFTFHVKDTVACGNWQAPPRGDFVLAIYADNLDGAATLQTMSLDLDLDVQSPAIPYTFSENFTTDPGWTTGTVPDDDGACPSQTYTNVFHWCALCGNGNGGYGAWTGNAAFATVGQSYPAYTSSVLYGPTWTSAVANPTVSFFRAYGTVAVYHGASFQYKINAGAWTTLSLTGMATATALTQYCMPLASGAPCWLGATSPWATVTATIPAVAGNTFQVRWRLGGDSSTGNGTPGYGVDTISTGVNNLGQTQICEPTRNTGLSSCAAAGPKPVSDGTATLPGTPTKAIKAGGSTTVTWDTASCGAGSTNYNIYWGSISGGYSALTGGACAIGSTGTWTGVIPDGSWYVIVGTSGTAYGSFGLTSGGAQEVFTGAATACAAYPTQNTGGTCP